ncbi:MAG: hypothetical protein BWY95_01716 [Bacteroidetes bacterium ADurb.BinA104]|nr:MAG: hypothetical protein BWY95_01716 [Bacteroidetes bacterium ADurb.BinA104]
MAVASNLSDFTICAICSRLKPTFAAYSSISSQCQTKSFLSVPSGLFRSAHSSKLRIAALSISLETSPCASRQAAIICLPSFSFTWAGAMPRSLPMRSDRTSISASVGGLLWLGRAGCGLCGSALRSGSFSGGSVCTFGLACALSVGGRPIISFHTSSRIARSRSLSLR